MTIYLLVALFAAGIGFLGGYALSGSEYRPLELARLDRHSDGDLEDGTIVEPKVVHLPPADGEVEEPAVVHSAR